MSDPKIPAPQPPTPPTKPSGEHQAVKKMREKFESIQDHTAPQVDALNERIDKLANELTTHPPTSSEEDLIEKIEEEIAQEESEAKGETEGPKTDPDNAKPEEP